MHTRRKLFYTGTTALLSAAVIYHSVHNALVQSEHELVGFLLPLVTFIPMRILLKKRTVPSMEPSVFLSVGADARRRVQLK